MIAAVLIAVIGAQQVARGYEGAWFLLALAGVYAGCALYNALFLD